MYVVYAGFGMDRRVIGVATSVEQADVMRAFAAVHPYWDQLVVEGGTGWEGPYEVGVLPDNGYNAVGTSEGR
jgi:hypothetical protein